jgi:AcrR family transcriptional regulator
VAQVKKAEVREAILEAAFKLFCKRGFNDSTVNQIASEAGYATANVYSYFDSKLDILYQIYDPWLRERLEKTEAELEKIADPKVRLRRLICVLWREIPVEANGFANNIMQAFSGASSKEYYDLSLLRWAKAKVSKLILESLPESRRNSLDTATLAHLVFMAFDGFAMHAHLNQGVSCSDGMIDLFCDMILGSSKTRKATPRKQ